MALNSSGSISLAGTTLGESIQIELGGNGATQISLNDSTVRTLAGVSSGQIVMPTDFYGKSDTFSFNLTTASDVNLRTAAIAAGWNGTSQVIATIPTSNTISASSTSGYALTVNGSFPKGVTLINNGLIVGKGGAAGKGADTGVRWFRGARRNGAR